MADAALKRIESFQYPAAHLGHLTENQQAALESFKNLCQDEGYYKPAQVGGRPDPSHDDETMLRYLRARRFNPKDAFAQFKDTEEWRKENNLVEWYDTIDVKEYDDTRRLYPQWTGRRDRRGIPVYVFEVAHLNAKNMSAYDKSIASGATVSHKVSPKMLRLFALYENLTRFVMPLCSAITDRTHPETPISQSNNIVDISKVGLKQFWNLKGHMQDASTLATAHYPETLDRIFIIGAPSFFPTVWGWVKRWFDPITVSKIFILSHADMKPTLEKYIDPANIPKKYGGNLDFEFGMMPILEPAIEEALKWDHPSIQGGSRTIPTGPIKWEESADGTVTAVAVGTENKVPRRSVVAELAHPVSIKAMHGSLVTSNTPITEDELALTTAGTATQPPDSSIPDNAEEPAGEEESPSETTLPIRENKAQETRAGTSSTRFEQQAMTHAHGQLAEGTPAVNDHGFGDKTVTMEPSTVGQAPKDVSVPPAEEPPAPGYLEQAKGAVGSAATAVTAAAGSAASAVAGVLPVGGKNTETKVEEVKEKTEEEKEQDRRVDAAKPEVVEGFLRSNP
ncbi:CRAL/TRIO domain-containing protein [Lophium mytilinum]|uniref:CRAL/TRIO domain-containing protein n=1 Tax=Lophium mytilinum TaxID=390894 RepID=A0A6A6R8E3_9PEZI|nr:CRAL/TRIO domain-containing protein [Lophium mytilinum]